MFNRNPIIENSIEKLKGLPIFYLSLTSKELFHSNFLYWLSKLNLECWAELFNVYELEKVEREISGLKLKKSLTEKYKPVADLVGSRRGEKILVIENKVKDIPHLSQLEFLNKAFGHKPKFVLLSFVRPMFSLPPNWVLISYRDLAHLLENKIYEFSKGNLYFENLIKDYVELVKNLQLVFDCFPQSGDYNFTKTQNKKLYTSLEKVKLWQTYQRIAGTNFEMQIRDELNFPQLRTHFSITTQKACNDFFFEINGYNIGVQIEANQYRKYLYGSDVHVLGQKLIDSGLWFNDKFEGKGTNKGQRFNSFNIGRERKHFIYQYEDVFINNYDLTKKGISYKISTTLSELYNNFSVIQTLLN